MRRPGQVLSRLQLTEGALSGLPGNENVFAHAGGYRSVETFTHGTSTAVWVGGATVAVGALAAALIPRRARVEAVVEAESLPEAA